MAPEKLWNTFKSFIQKKFLKILCILPVVLPVCTCNLTAIIELQPRMKGWLLASVDGKTVGIIPANYVKVLGKKRGQKYQSQIGPQNSATSQQPWSQEQGSVGAPQLNSASPATSEVKTPVSSKSSPDLDNIFRSSGNNDAANMEAVDILDKSTS